jgi:hypothetical protein
MGAVARWVLSGALFRLMPAPHGVHECRAAHDRWGALQHQADAEQTLVLAAEVMACALRYPRLPWWVRRVEVREGRGEWEEAVRHRRRVAASTSGLIPGLQGGSERQQGEAMREAVNPASRLASGQLADEGDGLPALRQQS